MAEALHRDDEYEHNGSSGSQSDEEPKYNVTNIADRAKQKMGQGMAKAGEEVERGKDELAEVLDHTAQRLESTEGEPDSMRTKARISRKRPEHGSLPTDPQPPRDRQRRPVVRAKHPFHVMGVVVIIGVLSRIMR